MRIYVSKIIVFKISIYTLPKFWVRRGDDARVVLATLLANDAETFCHYCGEGISGSAKRTDHGSSYCYL